jgi:hypothetical protein
MKTAPTKGRLLKIAGADYRIQFTMLAISKLAEKYGDVSKAFEAMTALSTGQIGHKEITALVDLLSAALITHHPEMTPEKTSACFEVSDFVPLADPLVKEFLASMGVEEDSEPDADPTAAQ